MPQTKKQLFALFAITFTIKIVLAIYFSHLQVCQIPDKKFGYLALDSGDTFSYFGGMDNLLEHGEYYFWNGARNVYAGRMPYYGAPYFFFVCFSINPLLTTFLSSFKYFLTLWQQFFSRGFVLAFRRSSRLLDWICNLLLQF